MSIDPHFKALIPYSHVKGQGLSVDPSDSGSESKGDVRKIESVFSPFRGDYVVSDTYKAFGSSLHIFVMNMDQAQVHAKTHFPDAQPCVKAQLGNDSVSEDLICDMKAQTLILFGPPPISVLHMLLNQRGDERFYEVSTTSFKEIAEFRQLPVETCLTRSPRIRKS
jgi:hypothetical protein